MVNSKNLLSAGVMSLAIAAIVTYMQVNGLTTEDISLVDACYKASQAKGINVETCDEMKKQNYEWDTAVPCVTTFKEEVYFYTPRMMFGFMAGGKTDIAELGRKNKGETEGVVYTQAQNLTFAEALQDRCAATTQDEHYAIWLDISNQLASGVKPEDVDTSKYQDRELYGWNSVVSWAQGAISNLGNYLWDVIQYLVSKSTQYAADAVNYRCCSLGLALKFFNSNLIDRAECSGKHPTNCKKSGSYWGPNGWWTNRSQGSYNRLNKGCRGHDQCLEIEGSGDEDTDVFYQCDEALSNAGKKGVNWHWPGLSCGWRGCRGWWFGWKYSTSDSRIVAASVWLSMGMHPNG